MIDIHSHVLVDVDDGPKTIDEALNLLRQAKNEGVTEIVVTPHHLHPNWDNEFNKVEQKLEELKRYTEYEKIGVKLYLGQEIRIKDTLFEELDNGKIKGLNDSNYLLIELPSGHVPSSTKQIIFELQSKGYVPIIAHPERNKAIASNPALLYELVNAGALAQLTSSSLNGDLGKKIQKISIQMIEHNLVHFIASDAHETTKRPFLMKNLLNNKKLQNLYEDIDYMFKNAQELVKNNRIYKRVPEEPIKTKKFLGLF